VGPAKNPAANHVLAGLLDGVAAMRIVAGRFRGRPIAAPVTSAIRPTSDRTRESVFNMLASRFPIDGARVIDLFAGTGALGLEAMSRGASFVLFVEESVEGRGLLRTNIETLGLQGASKIFRRDATDLGIPGTMEPFDLAFADPPYAKGLGEKAAASLAKGNWLKRGAMLVLEEKAESAPAALEGFHLLDQRRFGETIVGFFEREG
jgi:16S rRNA (guanine966-N2)-methyltransferase